MGNAQPSLKYELLIRPAEKSDEGMIYKAWLESYRSSVWLRAFHRKKIRDEAGNDFNVAETVSVASVEQRGIPEFIYYPEQRKRINRLVGRGTTLIACAQDDLDHVYGFICGEKTPNDIVVHYWYVKSTFRRFGIGRQLLQALGWDSTKPLFYTHPTWASTEIGEKHFKARFNPWRVE